MAPDGQVIEIDLGVAAAKHYDIAVSSELQSAAEAGMPDALISETQTSG